jgi:NAD(P)-dependent dehydrogenase (short-subunit alcohol dehydrogenase family)
MTTTTPQKVALVTGASSGIGRATALQLHEAGFVVYGVARRTDRMQELRERGIKTLAMDVTDDESTTAGVKEILAEAGRIDVLVNNAGYGSYGAVEDVPLEEARRQFEVNVFGAARLIQLVLPGMRERHSGTIVNISSMGGKIYTPFGAWYHGTKFALEAVSDCLRLETKPFGIDVVVIEPGGIRTEWSGIAADHLRETSGQGAYADQAKAVATAFSSDAMAKRSSPPEVIAKTVAKAATARRPKTRYAVGSGAKPLMFLRRWLPDRAYDTFIRRVSGIR